MPTLPKRFYQTATVVPLAERFTVALDGRAVKTIARAPLAVASKPLAEAIAREWQAQQEVVDAETMPLTRLANIAIDRIPTERAAIAQSLLLYAETDLLCYRAKEPELAALQVEYWDPVLEWLREQHAITLVTTTGVVPIPQPQVSLDALNALVESASAETFAGLAMLVPLLGSLLLGLAVWKRAVSLDHALTACRLDESYQAERWGKDEEVEGLWEAKARDLQACAQWLHLVA